MKTGILTYHYIPNFGAILQAFALAYKMRELSIECEIVDYECKAITKRELVRKRNNNPIKDFILFLTKWKQIKKKIVCCKKFLDGYVSSEKYYSESIIEANKLYDCFVTGSDMVWNLEINGHDYSYFLDFTEEDKKRVSYASSIGSVWNREDFNKIYNLLNRYDNLSTREFDTCKTIRNDFNLNCQLMPDPTVLLKTEDWIQLTHPIKHNNYVVVYFPNEEITKVAKEYSKKNKKNLVILDYSFPWQKNNVTVYSPNDFLSYLLYSDAVFTDSYHGLLFALYFNKKVWTNNHSNRVKSIIEYLSIDGIMIDNPDTLLYEIDFDSCNSKFEELRRNGIKFIKDYLRY